MSQNFYGEGNFFIDGGVLGFHKRHTAESVYVMRGDHDAGRIHLDYI